MRERDRERGAIVCGGDRSNSGIDFGAHLDRPTGLQSGPTDFRGVLRTWTVAGRPPGQEYRHDQDVQLASRDGCTDIFGSCTGESTS